MDWRDQWVHFKISDIYHPDPATVLTALHGNDLLTGKVIDLSDSGMQKEVFAIIKVKGIEELLVVPVERILDGLEHENASEPT